MFSFFKKRKITALKRKATTPENTRIYAVGDIHGRYDLLTQLSQKIQQDAAQHAHKRCVLIYVGDYIDRGLQSKAVIESIVHNPLSGFEIIHLRGNHEEAMVSFLEAPQAAAAWLQWGGDATLRSYDVKLHSPKSVRYTPAELAKSLAKNLPVSHAEFLQNLALYHKEGDYVFVHAGLRPGVPLESQQAQDLMTIREPFIFSKTSFPYTIVFGHTIFETPFIESDRIGIDTGAYASNILTCAVFDGEDVEFINTQSA